MARVGTVNDELVGLVNHCCVAVARDIPHEQLIAGFNLFPVQFGIHQGRTPHIGQRCLPANDLRHHLRDQTGIIPQFLVLVGVLVEGQHAATDGVAGSVVTADYEQDEVAEELQGRHIAGVLAVGQHGDQIAFGFSIDPLVPQPGKVLKALQQFLAALLKGNAITRAGSRHI